MRKRRTLYLVILAVLAVFLLFPLLAILLYSLFSDWTGVLPSGFTFDAYREIFSDMGFWAAVFRSVLISVVPVLICTAVVLLAMYVVVIYLPGFEKMMQILCTIPYAIQGIILPISILTLYADAPDPLSNRIFMLISVYCIVILPYIYQGIQNSLYAIQATKLIEASELLGAGKLYAFFKVIVPNIMGGIKVSSMLALAIIFADFTIVNVLAGNYYPTAQMYLYETMKKSGQKSSVIIMTLFCVTLILSGSVFIKIGRMPDKEG